MISKTRLNFLVDSVAGVLFLLSLFSGNGSQFHVGVAVAFTVVLAIHIALHWKWIRFHLNRLTVRRTRSTARRVRMNFAVDMLILSMFVLLLLSGAALIASPGDETPAARAHRFASVMFIVGTITHVALHWGWIMANIRAVVRGSETPPAPSARQRVVTACGDNVERRREGAGK